jgi:hypothetical protein
MTFCIECGNEVKPREEDSFLGAEFPGGILCHHCYERRSELERRVNREWYVALWEDGPWWAKALLIVIVPVGFFFVFAAEMWGVGLIFGIYIKFLEAVERVLEMLGLGGSLASFLAILSPLLLLLFVGLLGWSYHLIRHSFDSERK